MARIPSFSLRRPGRIATAGALAALVLLAGLPTSVPGRVTHR